MTTQRIRMVTEPTTAGPARSHSLRRVLWLGTGACFALAIVAFVVVSGRILSITEARGSERGRYAHAAVVHKDRLAALYEQHIAQRAYLMLGDPDLLTSNDRGRERETRSLLELSGQLSRSDAAAMTGPLGALDHAIYRWREEVWRPRILARSAQSRAEVAENLAPLLAEVATAFEAVRAEHGRVAAALDERMAARIASYQRSLTIVVIGGLVMVVLTTGFMALMVSWILRRTVRPLEDLSRIAASGAAFPAPAGGTGIREVDALTTALYELDLTVRDREQRLAAAHDEAVALTRFGEHVQQITEEDELQHALAARLTTIAPGAQVHTLMRNPSQTRLDVALSTTGPIERTRLPILAEPMRCRAVRTLRQVHDVGGSPTACRCPLAPRGRSHLCEPMLAAGELIGVVNLQGQHEDAFSAPIEQSVHNALGFASTALASIRLLAATRDRAIRDPLTGAYNRAFLDEFLGKQLALGERNGSALGVLLLDLDHFKRLNDTHGHAVGDRALVAAVAAAQREVRASDAVVRYGGEEIVVVLADTPLAGAIEAGERVRRAIEAVVVVGEQGTVAVRASIGVSAFPGHGRDQTSLMAAADRALYQAKATGRNRVVAAELDVPSGSERGAPAPPGN